LRIVGPDPSTGTWQAFKKQLAELKTQVLSVFYLWRPNLPGEGDTHLIELALAGAAATVVTQNVRDLREGSD